MRIVILKKDKVTAELNSNCVDVVIIVESWLTNKMPSELISITGYRFIRKDRNDGRIEGGLPCYVRDTFLTELFVELHHPALINMAHLPCQT